MLVECLRTCDVSLGREVKALFPGQFYEMPDEMALPLIEAGAVVSVKAVEGPAQDKAVDGPPRTKARGRGMA